MTTVCLGKYVWVQGSQYDIYYHKSPWGGVKIKVEPSKDKGNRMNVYLFVNGGYEEGFAETEEAVVRLEGAMPDALCAKVLELLGKEKGLCKKFQEAVVETDKRKQQGKSGDGRFLRRS